MTLLLRGIVVLGLLSAAVFCLFGFLATFEPTNRPVQFTVFRIGYVVIGLLCLMRVARILVKAVRHRHH